MLEVCKVVQPMLGPELCLRSVAKHAPPWPAQIVRVASLVLRRVRSTGEPLAFCNPCLIVFHMRLVQKSSSEEARIGPSLGPARISMVSWNLFGRLSDRLRLDSLPTSA